MRAMLRTDVHNTNSSILKTFSAILCFHKQRFGIAAFFILQVTRYLLGYICQTFVKYLSQYFEQYSGTRFYKPKVETTGVRGFAEALPFIRLFTSFITSSGLIFGMWSNSSLSTIEGIMFDNMLSIAQNQLGLFFICSELSHFSEFSMPSVFRRQFSISSRVFSTFHSFLH